MWRFLCAKQFENVQVLMAEKKSAWTDLDQVDFEKISLKSRCPNRKIGVDWSRQSQKASSAASVFKILQDRSPGGRRCVLYFDGLPLTRGVVDAYTLRGCVFADIQSHEEVKDALAS